MDKGTLKFVAKVMVAIAIYDLIWYLYISQKTKGCNGCQESMKVGATKTGFVTIDQL